MSTVANLINGALQILGVIASGETPSTDENAVCLISLNNLLSSWSTEQLTLNAITNVTKVLTASTGTYTIGSGGAISTTRPTKIMAAGILQSNGLRSDLDIVPFDEWAAIPEKSATAVQPLKLYNDNAYPTATLSLWPIPSGTPTLDLYVEQPIAAFSATTDSVSFPPGWERALQYNLAVDLAPIFDRPLHPAIVPTAQQAKAAIVTLNASNQAGVLETALPAAAGG